MLEFENTTLADKATDSEDDKTINMEVEYLYYEGQPSEVIPSLIRSVGQYHRNYEYVKIGITAAPERRFREHLDREKSIVGNVWL